MSISNTIIVTTYWGRPMILSEFIINTCALYRISLLGPWQLPIIKKSYGRKNSWEVEWNFPSLIKSTTMSGKDTKSTLLCYLLLDLSSQFSSWSWQSWLSWRSIFFGTHNFYSHNFWWWLWFLGDEAAQIAADTNLWWKILQVKGIVKGDIFFPKE